VVQHIPSLPYRDAPAFYRWLTDKQMMSALALRFLILTATRTSEVRFATGAEVDGDLWVIPAERTKTGRVHRVPLTDAAGAVIAAARTSERQTLLFPTGRGKVMSDATMSGFLKREGFEARPHGFRATFRSWAEECTQASFEAKETALGHQVGSDVERAYQRSDLLEQRRQLLTDWAAFLTGS
jgi:integrase